MLQNRHTIIHGNCVEILSSLSAGSIDAVVTDPPYLVDYKGRWGAKDRQIAGDRDDHWLHDSFARIYDALKDNSFCVSFYGWPHVDRFMDTWKRVGFRPISHLVFVKNQMGLGWYSRCAHEQAYVLAKGHPPRPTRAMRDVLPFTRVRKSTHPTQKPQDSLRPLVELVSTPGDLILDPFCGSGAVGEAALFLGRRFLGIEIDAHYAAVAQERLATLALPCVVKTPTL